MRAFSNVAILTSGCYVGAADARAEALSIEILNLAKQIRVVAIRSGSSPGGALHYNGEVDRMKPRLLYCEDAQTFDKHGRMDVDACMESSGRTCGLTKNLSSTFPCILQTLLPEDKLTDIAAPRNHK